MKLIETTGLTRTFQSRRGPVHAVRGIDLTVPEGEILGFLGPNGAGKTTTLRMLTTLLPPTGGTARVAGCDLAADTAGVRRRIGYVAQSSGVDPHISVLEELVTQARLYRLSKAQAATRAEELLHDLDLTALAHRPTGALSGGQRRRLDIAMALTHRPPLLFLDEPTTGLDPRSRADLWQLVRRLRDEHGTTVFLTTHYLDEADALADRIVVVDHGLISAEGTPAELKTRYAGSADATLQDAFLAITGHDLTTGTTGTTGDDPTAGSARRRTRSHA
ncbi:MULTISPECIES: ABC transporter ATP-binding protein [Streptacidiphilus]|uniref:ABC transporter ATP-binding protein n=1 Tax=Streptacidiphilus cavernicola TaxID=3342716 RepID=A0ABV6UKB9_9ACTN|nr:ATP-binding cassette domain-containing protein [Streptacidiphilus jeojiense]